MPYLVLDILKVPRQDFDLEKTQFLERFFKNLKAKVDFYPSRPRLINSSL